MRRRRQRCPATAHRAEAAAHGIASYVPIAGGDTLPAVAAFDISGNFGQISTGGAFLEFLEGETLPAIAVHEEGAAK